MNLDIPERLRKAILFARGAEDGEAWLKALPRRVDGYAARWGLDLEQVAEGGAMSCCIFATTQGGREAVLKIPFDAASGRLESRSLRYWSRAGASPDILATATTSGVFLMSRVRPGTTAVPTGSSDDAQRFADLMTRLARPGLGRLTHLRGIDQVIQMRLTWARERFLDPGYETETQQLPGAERLHATLSQTTHHPAVIHADLQSKNILVGPEGRWQAIDPFTSRGDLNAEAALWAVVQDDGSTIDQRITQLTDATPLLDPIRLRAWCYVLAVLEYRNYLPGTARRTRDFTTTTDRRTLIESIQETACP
jgi:streptomycin 6-kinase